MTSPALNQPRDWGLEAHQAAEAHLGLLWAMENGEGDGPEETAGPWCGCETCVIREVLHAAWPYMIEAAKEQVRASLN